MTTSLTSSLNCRCPEVAVLHDVSHRQLGAACPVHGRATEFYRRGVTDPELRVRAEWAALRAALWPPVRTSWTGDE